MRASCLFMLLLFVSRIFCRFRGNLIDYFQHILPPKMSSDFTAGGDSNKLSPESPNHNLLVPSPIVTRRTRTLSTCARATENLETGKVKAFCRSKGHGFITPDNGGCDIFVHISDIEGEYVPLPGDQVQYKLCPVPPKFEKNQAIHVNIINFTPEVHLKWDCPNGDGN